MREISVWPIGCAMLVRYIKEIPQPNKYYGAWDAYRFYKTELGIYAIKE